MRIAAALALLAVAASAQTMREQAPNPKVKGKFYRWQTEQGFPYTYRVPKSFKAKKGATLFLVLRGVDRRARGLSTWVDVKLREHDVLLHPGVQVHNNENTMTGSLDFTRDPKLADRIHAVHQEFVRLFNIKTTVVHGAGRGASFALYYAARHPQSVQAAFVAGAAFADEKPPGPNQAHQKFAFVHFVPDPQVAFADVRATWERYAGARLSLCRVKSGTRRDYWQVSRDYYVGPRLAWVEAATATDPARLEHLLEEATRYYADFSCDYGMLYAIACRLRDMPEARRGARNRAKQVAVAIEKLAAAHVKKVTTSMRNNETAEFEEKAWVGHLPLFLDAFAGVPARDKLAEKWKFHRDRQRAFVDDLYRLYLNERKDPLKAFHRGCEMIRGACIDLLVHTSPFSTDMDEWRRAARKLDFDKADIRAYDLFISAKRKGNVQYLTLNAKFRP